MMSFVSTSGRFSSVFVLSFLVLHCGTTPGPDGDMGSGGESPGSGGENVGGEAGASSTGGALGGSGNDAGGGPAGGSGGGADESPVTELAFNSIDKVDLLFVVDNSVSMADKQQLLVQAVPKLIERLVTPDCIDLESGDRSPSEDLSCPLGTTLEIEPVEDLHVGVISSSLGGFGTAFVCGDEDDDRDRSRLIPKVRPYAPDPGGLGFLEWNGGSAGDVVEFEENFVAQLDAVGETGCGFEAPLEAWYRFLVDPSPPADVELVLNVATSTGSDAAILQQRAEFLRPDSLVAIVMLTDEDDCSAMEGGGYYPNAGYGWLVSDVTRPFNAASDACATNPNDACCYSCLQDLPPDGCTDTCDRDGYGNGVELSMEEDRANVRCFQNKRRFGVDLLYPVQRYIDGLQQATIVDTQLTEDPDDPVLVPNPLLRGASLDVAERSPRPPNQVFLAGIVGVPWQDIATPATRDDPDALKYIDAKGLLLPVDELGGEDRWALILGQPNLPASSLECEGPSPPAACGQEPMPPLDPFMIQSIVPRSGDNPITGDTIVGVGVSAWSPINGSEYDNSVPAPDAQPSNDDLQYACIFPLSEDAVKTDCTEADASCDCGTEPDKGRPLCKPPGSQASTLGTTNQYWGKAYPAKRLLQVLQGVGESAIVASICPKIVDEPESPYFGYNPALDAVIERLAGTRGGVCLSASVPWDGDDEGCAVVEATTSVLDCGREGRAPLDEALLPVALAYLEDEGHCSPAGDLPCEDYGLCAVAPVDDPEPCFGAAPADTQPAGYCFISPAEGPTAGGQGEDCTDDPATWEDCENPNTAPCPGAQGRMVRFVGENTPERGAIVFRVCGE